MPTLFFTSDEHYDHKNVLLHQANRADLFASLEEMQEGLISRHNEVVKRKDIVYHLGDFAFKSPMPFVRQLNGKHILLRGNHDYWYKKAELAANFTSIHDVLKVKWEGIVLWLSHYPHLSWPRDNHGVIHLHGHCHGGLKAPGKSLDVGVDANDFRPLSLEEIIEKAAKLPLPLDRHGMRALETIV